jgi:sarcosine/dimethylglycine N-methyltransferase
MSDKKYSDVVDTARDYYNSPDADNFYYYVWGGEDLHLGIYESEDDTIFTASKHTIDKMAELAGKIDKNTRIIDLGGGFSGTARHLAGKFACHVTVLNLSEAENKRGREMNREQGLDHLIEVIDGSFEDIPCQDESFDIVWSQDAILHSGNRKKVLEEANRVLKKGGQVVFSDPMQTDNCDTSVLQPVYDRIKLASLGSPSFYIESFKSLGLKLITFNEMTNQLVNSYSKVLSETEKKRDFLKGKVSDNYIENMKNGLNHWVKGGKEGNLTWGIFVFKK